MFWRPTLPIQKMAPLRMFQQLLNSIKIRQNSDIYFFVLSRRNKSSLRDCRWSYFVFPNATSYKLIQLTLTTELENTFGRLSDFTHTLCRNE